MLKELPNEDVEARCAIGDKGFDARDVMEEFYHRGITSAVAVKETFRMGMRDELRKKSTEGYKLYGRDRYLVESLLGTSKQAIGSHFWSFFHNLDQKNGILKRIVEPPHTLTYLLKF
ncbi:MAG: hypothetical protein QW607_03730 [Desulfurococcaceae archaeon]